MNKIIVIILLSLVLLGCNENEHSEPTELVNQEYGDIQSELIDSLQEISGKNQVFKIDNSQPNTIIGENGTILIIPENSIVDLNGNIVKGELTIQLKETFTIQDFITSNLQTMHNDKILESKGMIYFSAQDKSGNALKIANNNPIRIQIPQKDLKNDPKIFIGNRDSGGLINWGQKEEPAKSLVPSPIKFISKNRFPTECPDYYGITTDTIKNKHYTYYGNLYDFENTLLATNEFNYRYQSACWDVIVKIYINNLDKNLWEIDEMVVDFFIKDSIERVEYYLNNPPPKVNGNEVTKSQWDAHNSLLKSSKEFSHRYINWFKDLAAQKLTKVDTTKLIDTTKLENINTAFIAYDAMKFGWVNVDFFYDDPKAVPVKLIAKTNTKAPIISLILNNRNIILSGSEQSSNEYWFTKNVGGYNKLPKGEKAMILAIGYDGANLTFGEREITIGENEVENLELFSITGEALKNKLKKYGS